MKNTYFYNHILNGFLWILFLCTISFSIYKSKNTILEKALMDVLILLLPVFLNSVIFVISDAKLQLLMSASYLIVPIFFLSKLENKYLKIGTYIILAILLRNYSIQDQASYITLENTYKAYDTVISSAIQSHINQLDKKYVVIGEVRSIDKNITNRNYGYIVDDGIFWEEYNLRKLGFERFCKQAYGVNVEFASEEIYQTLQNDTREDIIYEYEGNIVLNFNNIH